MYVGGEAQLVYAYIQMIFFLILLFVEVGFVRKNGLNLRVPRGHALVVEVA